MSIFIYMDAIANRNNRRPVWANNHDLLGNQGNHYNQKRMYKIQY